MFKEDLVAYRKGAGNPPSSNLDQALRVLTLQRLQAVALFRLAQWLLPRSSHAAALVKTLNNALTGCDISHEATIGPGLQLFHPSGVVIGPDCIIGDRCLVMSGVVVGTGPGGSPTIGDDVELHTHSIVVGGIHLGDRVSVGSNALVAVDIPAGGRARAAKAEIQPPRD
jgi:serine O-acetyltransferase